MIRDAFTRRADFAYKCSQRGCIFFVDQWRQIGTRSPGSWNITYWSARMAHVED